MFDRLLRILSWKRTSLLRVAPPTKPSVNWSRVVMNEKTEKLIRGLPFKNLRTLEISGNAWRNVGFTSYTHTDFPQFDICAQTLPQQFDLIIAEQVLEHVLWPYRAVSHVYEMLAPGGYFLVSVPFLIKIHNHPVDCSRWSELGLKHLLAECGFPLENIQTDSWGNTDCVIANFSEWVPYHEGVHSLKNEPDMPYHVWALAQKPLTNHDASRFRPAQNT